MPLRIRIFAPCLPGLVFLLSLQMLPGAQTQTVISAGRHPLRSGNSAEWEDFARLQPEGKRLDLVFTGSVNQSVATLFIRQDDVRQDWNVELNRKRLGKLFLMEADLVHTIAIPPGTIAAGSNLLSIIPPSQNDDVFIGPVTLDMRAPADVLHDADLTVTVQDRRGAPLPSRVTIVDRQGALAPLLRLSNSPPAAVRPGVVYSAGKAAVGLMPGDYTVYASRGFEWSVATQKVHVARNGHSRAQLVLNREVPTPGMVSSDTHIHIMSNHGDATEDERALTLAGEGIELPISTEHNTNISYAAAVQRMQVANALTPVNGCEVTTTAGHFNVFPVVPGRAPDYRITDWPRLMEELRRTPDLKVVILNHPRNVHNGFQPFAETNFNATTGENLRGPEFSFDAMELLNSSAQQSDYMLVFREWFGLLNYGYRVTAVGSSDGHDVSRYVVGQGRTYIACRDEDPGHLDVNAACASLLAGRALVSMGLLVDLHVNDRFSVGDLVTNSPPNISVTAHIMAPSWITATNVALYCNGIQVRELQFEPAHHKAVTWRIPRPPHDLHMIAIATGPGVSAPFWPIPRPYQPTSKRWVPRVIAATNPIWVDADGDGKFTPARGYAKRLLDQSAGDPQKLAAALRQYDQAIVAQVNSLSKAARP